MLGILPGDDYWGRDALVAFRLLLRIEGVAAPLFQNQGLIDKGRLG